MQRSPLRVHRQDREGDGREGRHVILESDDDRGVGAIPLGRDFGSGIDPVGNLCSEGPVYEPESRDALALAVLEVREGQSEHLVQVFGFQLLGFGFLVSGFGFRVSGFGFRGLGFTSKRVSAAWVPNVKVSDVVSSRFATFSSYPNFGFSTERILKVVVPPDAGCIALTVSVVHTAPFLTWFGV